MALKDDLARLRGTFADGRTRSFVWREAQLDALTTMLDEHQSELVGSLAADLGKPAAEAVSTDIVPSRSEIMLARENLRQWAAPRVAEVTARWQPGHAEILPQPLGVVAVIAPWNYPVQLLLQPVAAALAAGNCVVAKPSELSPATSGLLSRLLREALDPDAFLVVEGGVPETTELLAEPFDHIFYTGSTAVGRIVARAAAEHLTPVTLELGGKCPSYVHRSAEPIESARRIAWGKCLNAGQTCLAPDYVLIDRPVRDAFIDGLQAAITGFYGPDPKSSPDFGRIVSDRHFSRLIALRDGTSAGTIVFGGDDDRTQRYVGPTVLVDPSPRSPIMTEEIFGPLLPVIAVDGIDEALSFVDARPQPLASYVYTNDETVADRWLTSTRSGGATVNAPLLHNTQPSMPFGGVGESGVGAYHGQYGFDRLSHLKSTFRRSLDAAMDFAMPPYTGSA